MKVVYWTMSLLSLLIIISCGGNSTKENEPAQETKAPEDKNESEMSIQEQVNAPGLKKYIGRWERIDGYKEIIEITVDPQLGVKIRFPKEMHYAHYNIGEDYLRTSGGVGMKLRYEKEKDQIISSRDFAYKRVK